jgi:hypothetical protein
MVVQFITKYHRKNSRTIRLTTLSAAPIGVRLFWRLKWPVGYQGLSPYYVVVSGADRAGRAIDPNAPETPGEEAETLDCRLACFCLFTGLKGGKYLGVGPQVCSLGKLFFGGRSGPNQAGESGYSGPGGLTPGGARNPGAVIRLPCPNDY